MGVKPSEGRVYRRLSPLLVQYDLEFAKYPSPVDAYEDPLFDLPPGTEAILISRLGKTTSLNLTAALVWVEIDGVKPKLAIAESLARHFRVSVEVAEAAVTNLMAELEGRDLVGPVPQFD